MNKWVGKSLKLAEGQGYLDRLAAIYPVGLEAESSRLTREETAEIKKLYRGWDKEKMLHKLIELERFPYDEPYIGYFRIDRDALRRNPKTQARIVAKLKSMGIKKVLIGANKAKSESRKFGQSFRKWIREEWGGAVYTDGNAFLEARGIAFLDGGDKKLKEFAAKHFKYRRTKGLDFIARVNGKVVLGEAKFISAGGGTQDKSFREGISFLEGTTKNVYYVAVLDGIIWSRKNGDSKKKVNLYSSLEELGNNEIALSALLLKDFLKSLKRGN